MLRCVVRDQLQTSFHGISSQNKPAIRCAKVLYFNKWGRQTSIVVAMYMEFVFLSLCACYLSSYHISILVLLFESRTKQFPIYTLNGKFSISTIIIQLNISRNKSAIVYLNETRLHSSMHCARGGAWSCWVLGPGGCLVPGAVPSPGGVPGPRRVPGPGVSAPGGGVCSWGVPASGLGVPASGPGGVSQDAMGQTPPPP